MIGAETIVTDLRRYGETIRTKLRAEVQAAADELAGRAAQLAPRKTGALAASINAVGQESETKLLASVGTDIKHGMAYYGRFLESGWTPNSRRTFAGTSDILGPWGPATVSIEKAGWKRNPRNARGWRDYSRKNGKRKIVAYPFLKPALAQLRGRIRERMLGAVRGEG
jgi:hypothetical protein